MIEQIKLLRNVGEFASATFPNNISLAPFSLIYAENARGKTTLAEILRSLTTGNAQFINERHRLGAQNPPHIVIIHSGHFDQFPEINKSRETIICADTRLPSRMAIGVNTLPVNDTVEMEFWFCKKNY